MPPTKRRAARATEPRKEPKQGRARVTTEAILEATAHILIKDGFDRLTTNHVAERAGVSIGSIYQYFPGKEALVAALVDRHIDRMQAVVVGEMARAIDLPFALAVPRILRALVEANQVDADLQRAILEQVPRVGRLARIRVIDREIEALLHAALETRKRELAIKDTRLLAFVMVQTVKAVTITALLDHPEYVEGDKLARELSRMFVRYAARDA